MTRKTACYVPGCGYQDPDLIRFVEPTSKLLDIACDEDRAVVFKEIRFECDEKEPSGVGLFDYTGMPIAARVFTTKNEIIECWIEFNSDLWTWVVRYRGDETDLSWSYTKLIDAFDVWAEHCDAPYNPLLLGKHYEWVDEDDEWAEQGPVKPTVAKTPTPKPETYGTWS